MHTQVPINWGFITQPYVYQTFMCTIISQAIYYCCHHGYYTLLTGYQNGNFQEDELIKLKTLWENVAMFRQVTIYPDQNNQTKSKSSVVNDGWHADSLFLGDPFVERYSKNVIQIFC